MQGVSARFRGEVDDAAVETAKLRRWTIDLYLELLNGIDYRRESHLPRLGL